MLKEFFHIYPFSPLPTECEIITRKLYSELLVLGTQLLQWLEGGLPDRVKKVMTHQLPDMLIDSEENLMRVLHYPPIEEKEDLQAERAAAHEDHVVPGNFSNGIRPLLHPAIIVETTIIHAGIAIKNNF